MGLHPRMCSSLWQTMGGGSQKYEERPLGNARLNFEELTTVEIDREE